MLKSHDAFSFQNPHLLGIYVYPTFLHLRDGEGSQAGRYHPSVWDEDWKLQAQGSHSGGCLQGGPKFTVLSPQWGKVDTGLQNRLEGVMTSVSFHLFDM